MSGDVLSILLAIPALLAAIALWWLWNKKELEHSRKLVNSFDVVDPEEKKQLALSLMQQGAASDAVQHLKRAIDLRPKDAQLHHALGQAQLLLGNSSSAILHYDTAISLTPHFAEAFISRGAAYETRGEFSSAKSSYAQALMIDPKMALARYNLARVFALENDHRRCYDELSRAVQIQPALLIEAKSDSVFESMYGYGPFRELVYGKPAKLSA